MKKTLSIFALFSAITAFAGGDQCEQNIEKLFKKVAASVAKEVVMLPHIPLLATFAKAKLPDEDSPKLESSVFSERIALTDKNIPLPHNKEAFWYAYLKGDRRIYTVKPSTASPEIKESVEQHGQLVLQENTSEKAKLNQKIQVLNDTLSTIDAMINNHEKSKHRQ